MLSENRCTNKSVYVCEKYICSEVHARSRAVFFPYRKYPLSIDRGTSLPPGRFILSILAIIHYSASETGCNSTN